MNYAATATTTTGRFASFAASALLVVAAGSAYAQGATTVTKATGTGSSLGETHSLVFGNTAARNVNMGAWKVNEGTSSTLGANSFWVYCLDPLNNYISPDTYDKVSLSNFVNGYQATPGGATLGYASIFAGANYQAAGVQGVYDDSTTTTSRVLSDLTNLFQHAYADSITSSVKSAAFQFAIWEILGDGAGQSTNKKYYSAGYTNSGLDLNETGTTFKTQVDTYLAGLNGTWAAGLTGTTNYTFSVYNPNPSGSGQALIRATANAVPEPGSLALVSLAVFGVVYTRRKGKKS
ncbi:PEP-CTERM sorting domain-containing protein [Roseateles sp.]|uniref:PEP-CTERM sorting domain-containing protein n=1 Tax=Roseateles sp. TaxID=1971397 RepID=UPI003D0B40F3